MSSKKKVVREKSAEESSSPPKSFKFLLTATRAAVVATNNYPPCTDAINAFSARPYGAMNEADWKPRTEWEQLPPPVSVLTDIKKLIHGQAIWDDSRESASSPVSISQQEVLCQHITRGKLTHFWRREVSQRLASPLLYPHHSLGFDLSVSPSSPVGFGLEELRSSSPSKVALITANLIRAILRSHTNLCNTHADAQDPAYNPINNYEVLLGHSFYPVGYTGPEVERPGVSFGVQESSPTEDDAETEVPQTIGAGSSALPATAITDLKLVTHYDTLHINVCCGAFYYKVEILDGEKHTIKDERSIAADLDRIMQHAKEADMLKQHVVSAAVQEDFDDFYALLARTSAVTDVSDADLHRRLREVSPANAYALNALESGLFTVVLGGPLNPGRRERQSQWLHSMLSIYVSTDEVGYFEMRAHALAVSMATLQTFFLHVMSGISYSDSIDTPLRGARMKPSATPKLVRVSSSPAPTADSEVASRGSGEKNDKNTGRGTEASPAVALSESAQFFEMWLPLKHRVPLRPYEPISPTPQWFTLHAERFQCVADLCLHVVLAAERLRAAEQQSNNPESAPARPRVFFVAHTPNCTAPSAVLLYSPAVEKYIQAVRSQSVLITSSLREDARRTAAASISELMETCLRYPYPLYSMARCLSSGAPQLGVMSRADVCISVNLLTQQFMSGNGPQVPVSSQKPPFKVLRCTSQLGITADMYVNITAQQEKVQKQPILGDGGIAHAEVGYLAPYASSGERLMQMLVPSPS